jgi:hypothetical protein
MKQLMTGKQKEAARTTREASVRFANGNGKPIEMVFRLFDQGLAFRYIFPEHFKKNNHDF